MMTWQLMMVMMIALRKRLSWWYGFVEGMVNLIVLVAVVIVSRRRWRQVVECGGHAGGGGGCLKISSIKLTFLI